MSGKKHKKAEREPELKQVVDAPAIPVKVVVPYTDKNGTTHSLMGFLITGVEFTEGDLKGDAGNDPSGALWVYLEGETYVVEAQDMLNAVIAAHRARKASAKKIAALREEILRGSDEP
jgi:hypothetical protein